MNEKKTIEFPEVGVTITIPKQTTFRNIFVERKQDIPSNQPDIEFVINIGFFELDKNGYKKYISDIDPPATIKVYCYNNNKTTLVWWDKSRGDYNNNWWDKDQKKWDKKAEHKSKNPFYLMKKWKGFSQAETPGWSDDPSIGWR